MAIRPAPKAPAARPSAPAPKAVKAAPTLRSYALNLNPDPDLPVSLFDPMWSIPEVAARVARKSYDELVVAEAADLRAEGQLPEQRRFTSDSRSFVFPAALQRDGKALKAGSYGELHKHYSYGGRRPSSNFHAQGLCFGVDSDGGFFLTGRVGCWDGSLENEGIVSVRFYAGDEMVGAVVWQGDLAPKKDVDVKVRGHAALLAARFAELDRAEVVFTATSAGY